MAVITQYLNRGFQYGVDNLSQQQTLTDVDLVATAATVTIDASDTLTIAITQDVSKEVLVYISTDVTEGCSFNPDGTTPTFTVKGNIPYIWSTDCAYVNILSDDFTSILITNLSSTNSVNVFLRFLTTP